jgi:hypothetical protein
MQGFGSSPPPESREKIKRALNWPMPVAATGDHGSCDIFPQTFQARRDEWIYRFVSTLLFVWIACNICN